MTAYLSYLVPVAAAVFVGLLLWRSGSPRSLGYLTFSFFAGSLMFMVAVDTGWYRRVVFVVRGEAVPDLAAPNLEAIGRGIEEIKGTVAACRADLEAATRRVLGYRSDIEAVKASLAGYETEVFDPRTDGKGVQVGTLPESDAFESWVRFTLKHRPVPDSVLIWENELLAAPNRFTVEENVVTVKTLVDARAQRLDYTIRYFRNPLQDAGRPR
jgi:hypothetical protein